MRALMVTSLTWAGVEADIEFQVVRKGHADAEFRQLFANRACTGLVREGIPQAHARNPVHGSGRRWRGCVPVLGELRGAGP